MKIGIPTEIKPFEGRVGLIPAACEELVRRGHQVCVQAGAGVAAGYQDEAFVASGAHIVTDAAELYGEAELVVKVKEPVEGDLRHLRPDHLLFCFLHLAANRQLGEDLRRLGLTAVAFETVAEGGQLPLLAPMSEIAGRLSMQVATHTLHLPQGGSGVLLGGLPAAERGHVVVIGAGEAGGAAVDVAARLGADVTAFDTDRSKLARMRGLGANVTALYPFADAVRRTVAAADVVIGAVLLPGRRAPDVVRRAEVESMRPGSVVVDISVDQGGCIETSRPTTYDDPIYTEAGVRHFCVTNMPGAGPRTASQALSAALMPYVLRLARGELDAHPGLREGINVRAGEYVNPVIREELS